MLTVKAAIFVQSVCVCVAQSGGVIPSRSVEVLMFINEYLDRTTPAEWVMD